MPLYKLNVKDTHLRIILRDNREDLYSKEVRALCFSGILPLPPKPFPLFFPMHFPFSPLLTLFNKYSNFSMVKCFIQCLSLQKQPTAAEYFCKKDNFLVSLYLLLLNFSLSYFLGHSFIFPNSFSLFSFSCSSLLLSLSVACSICIHGLTPALLPYFFPILSCLAE